MKKYITYTFISLFYTNTFHAQDIELRNPSFEGEPQVSNLPDEWRSRGTLGYSDPDTQPNEVFEVSKPAKHGKTYIGMVTRADDSYEAITQYLESPLRAGEHYELSCYLARSDSYYSGTRQNPNLKKQHTQAIKLEVLGANALRGNTDILDKSPEIDHEKWEKYTFELKPEKDYHYIVFQASWITPSLVSYIGNVLIDDCSVIKCITCEEEEVIAEYEQEEEEQEEEVIEAEEEEVIEAQEEEIVLISSQPDNSDKIEEPLVEESPVIFDSDETKTNDDIEEEPTKDLADDTTNIVITMPEPEPEPKDTIKVGDIFKYETISFEKTSADLTDDSAQSLNEIFDFLYQNPDFIVEIGGHTNMRGGYSYSEELSQKRAESVMRYLIQKGIDKERMSAKGYGKEHPIVKDEKNFQDKRKNQRVEIKILSIGK